MSLTRRSAFTVFAAALIGPAAAWAQATVGPAGAVPSTTAPSNSEGTPAGGTGTSTVTRVQGTPPARPRVRRRRVVRHPAPAPQ